MSGPAMNAVETDRLADRALAALRRPLARIDPAGAVYKLRLGQDRRTRVLMTLDEAAFHSLARRASLTPDAGGWVLGRTTPDTGESASAAAGAAGRPGVEIGEREIVDPETGVVRRRRVNLGESPLAWLARRRDADGRPWLTPAELLAAERLRADWERAGVTGRLTMDWSGMPRGGAGWTGIDPAEGDRTRKERLVRATASIDDAVRPLVERVVFSGCALGVAERALRLPRGAAKVMLKLALAQLARHYGLA